MVAVNPTAGNCLTRLHCGIINLSNYLITSRDFSPIDLICVNVHRAVNLRLHGVTVSTLDLEFRRPSLNFVRTLS